MHPDENTLTEGVKYPFTVMKLLSLQGSDDFWVLSGPRRKKHLLNAALYRHYMIRAGSTITCRVDKIDCNGKIFLEPEHPHYREGKSYNFTFIRYEERLNYLGESESIMLVRDIHSNEIIAPVKGTGRMFREGDGVRCRVKVIRKGKVFLSTVRRGRGTSYLTVGQKHTFRVLKIARGLDDHEYFVLSGPDGEKHLLRTSYYTGYGITAGGTIRCTVVRYTSDDRVILEPDHPDYSIGREYRFAVVALMKEEVPGSPEMYYLLVNGSRSGQHKVPCSPNRFHGTNLPEQIICRLEKIRKGRLIFEIA